MIILLHWLEIIRSQIHCSGVASAAKMMGTDQAQATFSLFHIIILNVPFTRATIIAPFFGRPFS